MNIKKTISFFMILLVAVMLFSVSAMAASTSTMKISGETVEINPGEETNLEVTVDEHPGFTYLSFEVLYDAEQLELVSVTNGEVAQEMTWGTYIVLGSDENATEKGTLVELKFKTREDTQLKTYPVEIICIECSDYDENDVTVTTVNGNIIVYQSADDSGDDSDDDSDDNSDDDSDDGEGGFVGGLVVGGGSGASKYLVKFETNGGSKISNKIVNKNAILEAPEEPTKNGYTFDGWYTDKELTKAYDFSSKVTKRFTLYAKWVEIEKEPEIDNSKDQDDPETTEWMNPFSDVKKNDWFYANVQYVVENKLMNGIAADKFAPNDTLTRAMLVTVLYRNEGEPVVEKSIPFADVDMDAWYTSAVVWAKQNGIVNGVTETKFAPDANITREQIATIMFRYAQYKGIDAVALEENLHFTDADEISEYAVSAMNWAVDTGLMKGKSTTTINPKDNATRAEIATILQRFIESIE